MLYAMKQHCFCDQIDGFPMVKILEFRELSSLCLGNF